MRSHLPVLGLTLSTLSALSLASCETLERWDHGGAHDHRRAASAEAGRLAVTSQAFPTGDVETSAVLVEKRVPAEVWAGEPFDAEIAVTNVSSLDLESVVLFETLDDNLVLESAEPAPVGEDGVRRWELGDMAPGETRRVSLRASATEPRPIATCLSVSYDSALCSTIEVVRPALALAIEQPEPNECEEATVVYAVTNTGTGAARDVVLRIELPEGLTDGRGRAVIEREVGTLDGGETRRVRQTVRATGPGSWTHGATATGAGGLQTVAEPITSTFTLPRLELAKTGPEREYAGRTVRYVITLVNAGGGAAEDTVVEDELPAGAELVEAEGGGTKVGRRVRWELGRLEPGATREVALSLRIGRIGMAASAATATAVCANPVSATATTDVVGRPAVRLEVVDERDPVEVGAETTYAIRVTNQGTAAATQLRVAVTLPAAADFVDTTGPTAATTDPAAPRSVVLEPLASLAPKDEAVWRVRVRVREAADARFRVSLTSDQLTSPVEETEATNFYE